MGTLEDLGHAIAALARYANHDSDCESKFSLTNPKASCNCGFDATICQVSDGQDGLDKELEADSITIVSLLAKVDNFKMAIEHMDTKMTPLSTEGSEFVEMYQVLAGPWHRLLGVARG